MKNLRKFSLSAVLFNALMALLIATVTGWNVLATFAGLVLFAQAKAGMAQSGNAFFMAVTKEIWKNDIVGNLFKDNQWATRSVDASIFVKEGKVVHIPVAGAPSQVKKNLAVFPQVALKRTDTDVTYAIDTLYSIPRHIEKIEQYELSYDKRQSVVGEDQAAIIDTAMDNLLYRWAPAVAKCFLLEGAGVDATLTGATGQRTSFTKAIFSKVNLAMNKANVPKAGRVALLTADHYEQFFESLSEGEKTNFNNVANLKEGTIGRYKGFDIYLRSTVLRYRGADNALAAVDELDDAYAADVNDRAASIFWQETQTERALGEVNMFDDTNNPLYYGDIHSFNVRFGGRQRRAVGVYAAVEAIA